MKTERRRQPRKNGFKTGSLFFHTAPQQLDCLVWNLSDFGAQIEVEALFKIPPHFRLIATSLFIDCDCKLIWRDGRKAGVAFVF